MKQTKENSQSVEEEQQAERIKAFSEKVMDIVDAYDALTDVNKKLAAQLRKDHTQGLPILLPTYTGPEEGACNEAIKSLTQTWHPSVSRNPVKCGWTMPILP